MEMCPYCMGNGRIVGWKEVARNEKTITVVSEIETCAKCNGSGFKKLEAAQPKWISVEERLPVNEKTVLAATKHSFTTHNGIREIITVSAVFHTDGKTFSGDSKYNFDDGDVDLIYDEDNDEYIVPEGWWESTYFTEEFAAVDEEVLYWMPLPEPPEVKA